MKSNPLKALVQKAFGLAGLQIARKHAEPKYWGTGKLTPMEENSMELYDRFYGDAEAIEKYYQGHRMEFYKEVAGLLRTENAGVDGKSVLDVGCGVGYLLAEIGKAFKPSSLSGSDFSEEAMMASRQKFPGIVFFQHDIGNPLREKYDMIICTEVLEHLEKPWLGLKNLRDALNPGGGLVLTVPEGRRDYSNEHINFWSPESWKAFLERECTGAKRIHCRVIHTIFNFAIVQF